MNNLYKSTENQIEKYTLCHVPRLGRLVLNMSLYLALSGPNIACKEKNKPKQIPTQRSDTNLPQPPTLSSQSTLTQQVKQSASTNPSNKAPQKQPSTVQSSDKDPQTLFAYLNNTDHEKSARDVLEKMIKNFFGGLDLYQEDKDHYIEILTANPIVFLPKTNLEYFLNTHIYLINETKTIFSFLSDVWKKELEDEPKKSDQYFDKIEGFYINLKNDLETKLKPKVEDSSNQKYLSQAQQKHIESMRDEPDKRHIFAICYIYKEIEPLPDERLDKSGQSCKSLILEALRKEIKRLNDQITRQDKKFSQKDLAVYGIMPTQPQQPKQLQKSKTLDEQWKESLKNYGRKIGFNNAVEHYVNLYLNEGNENNSETINFNKQLENILKDDKNLSNHATIQEGVKAYGLNIRSNNELWNSFNDELKKKVADLYRKRNGENQNKAMVWFVGEIHDDHLDTEQKKLKKDMLAIRNRTVCWILAYIFETIQQDKKEKKEEEKEKKSSTKATNWYSTNRNRYHVLLNALGLSIDERNKAIFQLTRKYLFDKKRMNNYLKYKNKK